MERQAKTRAPLRAQRPKDFSVSRLPPRRQQHQKRRKSSYKDYMGVSLEKWRKLPIGLTSHFRLFHVAYDSLPTVIDVDVLDANVLLPTVTKPSKHLDLGRIGS